MEVVMDIMKHIGFMGLGIALVGCLSGAPVFAGDKHDKHIADGSKILITSPKDGDKVGDSFELKFELSKGSHGGHAHVFVDNEYQRGFHGTIKGLSKGEHQITVKAADKDHASVAATHTITVDVQ
jgi:FKBP-type peptidyl-prolyl cis-trans isomerase (trigger factor)